VRDLFLKNEAPTETPPSSASAFIIIIFPLLKEEWFNDRKNADT
jgi:hypothetical protein